MSTTARHHLRCSICRQFVATADRETLLEQDRLEWDEALVAEFVAATQHVCVDSDPNGIAWMARLADSGQMRPDLRDLIAAALQRKQAAPQPTFPGATTTSAVEPQDRTPAEVAADLDWLRTLRARNHQRWGGIYGGHDAHLDTIDYGGAFDGFTVSSDADPGL